MRDTHRVGQPREPRPSRAFGVFRGAATPLRPTVAIAQMGIRAILSRALLAAVLGWPAHACVDLEGIVSGGGDGLLDLDLVSESVEISNPRGIVAGAAADILFACGGRGVTETPIFMRDILGTCTPYLRDILPKGLAPPAVMDLMDGPDRPWVLERATKQIHEDVSTFA